MPPGAIVTQSWNEMHTMLLRFSSCIPLLPFKSQSLSFSQTNIFLKSLNSVFYIIIWTASSEFGIYRLCEQRRFRRACASVQSRQNLRCSLIQAVSQEEPSDRKPDPWPLWMAGHAQLKFVMTECLKTQIRLTGLISIQGNNQIYCFYWNVKGTWMTAESSSLV